MLILPRRRFLIGLGAAALAAPAIVRFESLMPVKPVLVARGDRVKPVLVAPTRRLYYQWLLNGVPIPGETGPKFTGRGWTHPRYLSGGGIVGKLSVNISHSPLKELASNG